MEDVPTPEAFERAPDLVSRFYDMRRAAIQTKAPNAVYLAAGLVRTPREMGAKMLEPNLEPSQGSNWFDQTRHGPTTQIVPAWVDEMLAAVPR